MPGSCGEAGSREWLFLIEYAAQILETSGRRRGVLPSWEKAGDLSASHGNRQGSIAVQQTEYYILYILNRLKIPIISDLKA